MRSTEIETVRRYAYRVLLLVAAITLVLAGMQAASVAPDALRQLTVLSFGAFLADVQGTVLLAAIALVAGMSALVVAPHLATGAVEFLPDERWRRIWAHDL